MKGIFFRPVLSMVLAVSFAGSAYGQQTNIHVSMPPLIDPDTGHARQVSASYIRMHGERLDLDGIDINAIFRSPVSNTTAWDFTLGAALLGSLLDGEMDAGTFEGEASGVVLHGSFNREFMMGRNHSPGLMLFMGIPFSFGSFIVENEEDVTVYNLLAGLQGGARLGFKAGDFKGSPLVMVNLMGGYRERYDGGVYLEKLDSGGVPLFAVISSGLEILYLPLNLTLSGVYQRTFKSGGNTPINTTVIQLGWSF